MESLPRSGSINKLRAFCQQEGSGLVFVRGRRRVGKTWLLQTVGDELAAGGFRLVCRKHRRDSVVIRDAVNQWVGSTGRGGLGLIKPALLTWKMLFDDLAAHAKDYKAKSGKSFVLIIDEVQWLSTSFEESAGVLKAAWDEWARGGCLRVIVCGSSTRFFTEQFGEGSVLRGIQTRANIDVLPFPMAIIKHDVVASWSATEAVLAYMCLGGIPYYWQRVSAEKGFRRAMNETCCTSSSILLDEWREIIATEFRTDAVESLSRLFPALMSVEEGVTQAEVTERLGLDNSTVSRLLEKLVTYGYVHRSVPEAAVGSDTDLPLKIARGARYVLSDFYLHFYFTVLGPMEREIRMNESGLLFPYQILQGDEKTYIPAFTGKAFERFVFHHVDVAIRDAEWAGAAASPDTRPALWRKLDLADANYEVRWNVLVRGETSDRLVSQIDVLLVHEGEKSVRVIECKWKGAGDHQDIDELTAKILPKRFREYARRNFLAASYEPTEQLRAKAKQVGVTLITLEDFL